MSEELWETVAKTFNKTKKLLDEDVASLEEWLETQPHLPKILSTNCLRNFLLINKFSIEVTKQKIDNYHTVKSKLNFYNEINPKLPYLERLRRLVYFTPYPQMSSNMYTYFYFKVKVDKMTMQEYDPLWGIQHLLNIQELRLRDGIIFGDVYILDYNNIPPSVVFKISPTFLYNFLKIVYQRVHSVRLKGVYFFNASPHAVKVINVVKKMIKPKVAARFCVYPDSSFLKDVIPADVLAKDYGGNGISLDEMEEILYAKFEKNIDLFDLLDEARVDENLRPEELRNDSISVHGVYGNFKQLDID